MNLRERMGETVHKEYVAALTAAKEHIDQALAADEPYRARVYLAAARGEIGRADTRAGVR